MLFRSAAAKLLGLDAEQIRQALNLAGTPNITLRQTRAGELSEWKGCAFANASRNGVFAALLALGTNQVISQIWARPRPSAAHPLDVHLWFTNASTDPSFPSDHSAAAFAVAFALFFVSRKWIYTAVNRATELKNVVFFNGATSGDEGANDAILDAYLEKKVSNYVKQDLERGREVTENFVTKEWLKAQFGKVCHDCGDCFRFDIRDGRVESNLSADRVDCSECHHLNNIVPLCVSCNQRKSCW